MYHTNSFASLFLSLNNSAPFYRYIMFVQPCSSVFYQMLRMRNGHNEAASHVVEIYLDLRGLISSLVCLCSGWRTWTWTRWWAHIDNFTNIISLDDNRLKSPFLACHISSCFCLLQMEDLILVQVGPRVEAYPPMGSKCSFPSQLIEVLNKSLP